MNVTTAPLADVACAVMFAGTVTVGTFVSTTVTAKLVLDVPAGSLALHLTVVVPIANVEPEEGVQLTGTELAHGSVAEMEYVATAPDAVSVPTVTTGALNPGGVSTQVGGGTVTANVVLDGPAGSLALHLTVVVPTGNVEPEDGVQLTGTILAHGSVAAIV